ncbi:WGR domain-containing protein [Bradyrhizobium barranii]|uniref:WGR domain-containing protein n=1 Tax=Bradyrhizobium barranii TaxID=2992140 RepID=UPI0038BA8448
MDFLVNHEVIPKPVELSAEALQGSESLAHDPAKRAGTTGQTMVQTFDASAEAGEAFGRLERAKRRRGYTSAEERV